MYQSTRTDELVWVENPRAYTHGKSWQQLRDYIDDLIEEGFLTERDRTGLLCSAEWQTLPHCVFFCSLVMYQIQLRSRWHGVFRLPYFLGMVRNQDAYATCHYRPDECEDDPTND